MQTQVQKNNSIRLWNWVLTVNWVNVGLIKDAKVEIEKIIWQIVASNWKVPPRDKIKWVKFSATLLELNLENLNQIFWWTFSSTNGTALNITNEAHGTGWTVGVPIKINNKNGDNTILNLTTAWAVKAGWSNLTRNTDFRDYVADGSNGEKWYTYIVPLTAQTTAITVTYSYTPLTQKKITGDDLIRLISMYPVEFYNNDSNWKRFWIKLFQAYATNWMALSLAWDEELDKSWEIPIELYTYPDSNNKHYELIDEQDV